MICFNCNSSIKEDNNFIVYTINEYFCGKLCAEFYYEETVGTSIEKTIDKDRLIAIKQQQDTDR